MRRVLIGWSTACALTLAPVLSMAAPALADPAATAGRAGPSTTEARTGTTAMTTGTTTGTARLPRPGAMPGLPKPSTPSPALASARKAAAALQAKVDALEVRTEQAVEHYDAVQAALKVATKRHQDAAWTFELAHEQQVAADVEADQRVRSLYISGGPPGLASVTVDGGHAFDLLNRYGDTRFVFQQDQQRVLAATAAAKEAAAAEQRLATALAEQQRLAREAAAAKQAVQAKLAAQRTLLASAGAQVKQLLAAQQHAEQEAAAALARAVRQAQAKAGRPGVALAARGDLTAFVRTVLAGAEAELGKPYQWGATGPGSYDCSGLVQHVFGGAGVALPRTASEQWSAGTHPASGDLQPGDLLFWATTPGDAASIHHVAIYLGNGYMIAAPHTGTVVQVEPVYGQGFFGVTRIAAPAQ